MLNKLRTFIQQLTHQRPHPMQASGQGLVEYALILVLVSVVSVGVLSTMGNEIADVYEVTACSLDSGEDCECRVIEDVVTSEFSCTAGDLFAYTALTTCGTDTELSLLSESSSSSDEYAMSYNATSNLFEMTNSTTICNELDSASPPQLYLVSRHTQDDGLRSFQLGANGVPTSGYGGGGSSASSGSGSGGSGSGGSDTGGSDTGGSDTGGSDTGGSDTGGSDTGGSDTGGSDTGGSDTGGSDTGGSDTGGSDTGGSDTGGSDTGGSDTGGSDTGGSDTGTGDTNNAPVMDAVGAQAVDEGASKTLTFAATDADGDTLTFGTTSDLPSFMTFIASSNPPSLTIAPGYSDAGTYSVTVGVIDGNGGNDMVTFDVVVADVNQLPVLAAVGDQTINETETKTITFAATDADGDTLTYGLSGTIPGFVTFNTPSITIAPGYDDAGTYSVTAYVTDTSGESDTVTFNIVVNNSNRDPFITAIPDQAVDEGKTLSIDISASDADGDTLTLSATDLEAFMSFSPSTAKLELTPGIDDSGTYNVKISVSDGNGGTYNITIAITVNDTMSASTVAFIVDNSNSLNTSDSAIKSRLESGSYTVNVFSDSDNSSTVLAGDPTLIIISESSNSNDVGSKYRNTAIPVIVMEPFVYDDMKMANDSGTDTREKKIKITNSSHPLAAGLSTGNKSVTSSNRTQGYGDPDNNNVTIIATIDSYPYYPTIFAYDTNTTMEGGVQAPARRVGFFAFKDTAEKFTSDGWKLFDAAVDWATG